MNAMSAETDTKQQKKSSFIVSATGHIEAASFPAHIDNLYCRYSFVSGLDWKILHGIDRGDTQTARRGSRINNHTITWNFPIEIAFESTNPHGWPRLCIAVYGLDWLGRDVVRG